MQNYDLLVERIAKSAGIEKEEIERKIEAKKAKLSGLISKEGAAQIIAAELGINFENVDLKIKELMPGMKKVNFVGKVVNLFPVREFERKGKMNKVVNFFVGDETGNVRVVLWDTNHVELIEKGDIKEGDVVEIKNGSMRDYEVHLSGFSDIKKSDRILENVKTEQGAVEKEIAEIKPGERIRIRGIVVQMFNPRFFYVCPECGKKAIQEAEGFSCKEHGKVNAKERALINFVVDDGSESVRIVLFSDQLEKLVNIDDLKDSEKLATFREDVLGSEFWIKGSVRQNKLFNNMEINVSDIEKVDVEKLIKELESN